MATSGTIRTDIRTGYAIQIAWTVDSQSVANNTSSVTAKVQLVSTGSSYTINSTASKSGTLTINGTAYSFTFSAALSGNQTKTIFTKTVTVAHNADGSKTCAFSTTCGINVTLGGTYYGNVTASGSGVFNTIARASTISSSTASVEVNGTNAVTVNISRASSSFTHTVVFAFGVYSHTISNVATSTSYAIPMSWLNAIPNATSGIGSVTVTTYSGSTKIGNAVSKSFTATVPASVVPSISSVSLSEAVAGIAEQFNGYVQNVSKLAVSVAASGIYSSTIAAYKTTILGATYTGASFTSGLLTESGSVNISVTVTDSRGRSASTTRTITVFAYAAPQITTFSAFRSDADGNPNYEGTNLKITVNFNIAPVNNLNGKYYEILYKVKGAESWAGTIVSGNIYSRNESFVTSGIDFSGDLAYELRLNLYDTFKSAYALLDIPTAFTLFDCRSTGKGIAFGKVSEADRMEIAMDVELTGELLQEDRQTPTLLNSWVNYGAAYETASFWKDSCGMVHLAGLIKSGATAAETVIFQLPAGYRPRTSEKFFCVSLNAICVIDVYSTGNVAIKTGANAGWLSLSGISFRAAEL